MEKPNYVTEEALHTFIDRAIKDDVGPGDYTTLACVPSNIERRAHLIVKDDCIIAGIDMAREIYKRIDPNIEMKVFIEDGKPAKKNDIAFEVFGNAQTILSTERFVLNCMQRMSGVASLTHSYVDLIKNYSTKIIDTRKTTPLFRMCEKWAVHIGGGTNYRYGLFDRIMIKDNHIDYAGGVSIAIRKVIDYLEKHNLSLKISIETRTIDEVREVLNTGHVDRIMLDNMSLSEWKQAVALIDKRFEVEVTGGIKKEKIEEIAALGVDFISCGSIIYSAPNIDLSLKAF